MAQTLEEHPGEDYVSLPISAIVTDDDDHISLPISAIVSAEEDDDYVTLPASAVISDDEGAVRIESERPARRSKRCPHCKTKLTDPDGMGWCSKCNYCRSVEEESKNLPDPDPKPSVSAKPSFLGVMEFGQLMQKLPLWVWVMIAGLVAVIGISFTANHLLPELCLPRALWSALQIVLGIVGLIASQVWAVLRYGSEDDGLSPKDIILPGRVWRVVIRRLPESCGALWVGSWCLTGIICGAFVIGGFEYWLEFLKEGKLRRMAAELERSGEVVTTNKGDTAVAVDSPATSLPATPATVEALCVVIGYQTDESGNLTGLVLATSVGNKLQYAGTVSAGLTPRQSRDLKKSLNKLGRNDPLIPGLTLKGVQWVKPGVFCDVSHTGVDNKGEFQESKIKEVRD